MSSPAQSSKEKLPVIKSPWSIVLHKKESGYVVLYSQADKYVSVRRLSNEIVPSKEGQYPPPILSGNGPAEVVHGSCPMCGREWDKPTEKNEFEDECPDPFLNSEYFRLLRSSKVLNAEEVLTIENPQIKSEYNRSQTQGESAEIRENGSESQYGLEELDTQSFNQGYYDRFFVQIKKIGNGQRGSVYLCQHILDGVPLGEFAVKAIPVGRTHRWLVKVLREVTLLGRLQHRNVIRYHHSWLETRRLSAFVPDTPCLFILMELADGGNLEEYIEIEPSEDEEISGFLKTLSEDQRVRFERMKQKALAASRMSRNKNPEDSGVSFEKNFCKPEGGILVGPTGRKVRYLTESQIWSFFLDVCNGLDYLHICGILHRDLVSMKFEFYIYMNFTKKPPNLLLKFGTNQKRTSCPTVVLSDFGDCLLLGEQKIKDRTGNTGTVAFMSPELLSVDQFGSPRDLHTIRSDVWSLGIILYYISFSSVPYSQTNDFSILKKEILSFNGIQIPDCRPRVSNNINDLIETLLQVSPEARPTTGDILKNYKFMRTARTYEFTDIPMDTIRNK